MFSILCRFSLFLKADHTDQHHLGHPPLSKVGLASVDLREHVFTYLRNPHLISVQHAWERVDLSREATSKERRNLKHKTRNVFTM